MCKGGNAYAKITNSPGYGVISSRDILRTAKAESRKRHGSTAVSRKKVSQTYVSLGKVQQFRLNLVS